jgi:HPt (histidine-containing phosphotransfer) domain-containing protein
MENNKQKLTNLEYLSGLARGDKKFIKKMITVFLEENPKEVSSLNEGVKEQNYDYIKASAHKLKSTIPFVGLDAIIGKEITEIESLAAGKTGIDEIKIMLEKVNQSFNAACEELNEHLKGI